MNEITENINWLELNIIPSEKHEWFLTTKQVAEWYWVTEENIRQHKLTKNQELINGKHFSVSNTNGLTYWTKKGIIRLWFFIKSERARSFRDWAEDFIINGKKQYKLPRNYKEALEELIESEEEKESLLLQNERQREILKEAKPKTDFYDSVWDARNTIWVSEFAKMIWSWEKKLFEWLRDKWYLFKRGWVNLPYQRYLDQKLFKVNEKTYEHPNSWETMVSWKTTITWKWQTRILEEFIKDEDNKWIIKRITDSLFW